MEINPSIPWIIAALVAVVALALLFKVAPIRSDLDTPVILDVAMIFSSILVLVLLWHQTYTVEYASRPETRYTNEPAGTIEAFTAKQSFDTDENGDWAQKVTSGTLMTYVSSFRDDSYPGTRAVNVWQSVAEATLGLAGAAGKSDDEILSENLANAAAASSAGITCTANGPKTSMDFTINNDGHDAPIWDKKAGFTLGKNRFTGPMSMDVLQTGSAYTVFMLFQLNGLPTTPNSAGGVVSTTLVSIPANNGKQNGMSITLSGNAAGTATAATMNILIGASAAQLLVDNSTKSQPGSIVSFDSATKYLLTVTRSSSRMRVSLYTPESSSSQCASNVLLDMALPNDNLSYSNSSIMINGDAGLNGNTGIDGHIMTFGIFNGALTTAEEGSICSHYNTMFLTQNAMVAAAFAAAAAATQARICPYNTTTCAACPEVNDWTVAYNVSSASASCRSALHDYCLANVTAPGCECYNSSNLTQISAAASAACGAIKSLYSGNTNTQCAAAIQQALSDADQSRADAAAALVIKKAKSKSEADMKARELELERREHELNNIAKIAHHHHPPTRTWFAWFFNL